MWYFSIQYSALQIRKFLYFCLAVIKDLGSPVRMLSLSRIRILIKAGAVKLSQSEGVSREMCRYPVEDDTNLMFMQIIHKELKILCGTVTGSRCKIAGYLISPGTVKRMLRDTHQFHMGVTHILHVSGHSTASSL